MSELSKYITTLKKQLSHYKRVSKMYSGLYHGTIPKNRIHLKIQDFNFLLERAKKFDKIKQTDILDIIVSNNEIDDYSVNEEETLKNWKRLVE